MTTYVALLRGINVGGRTKVSMGDLRQLFEAVGHTDVTTYIQSGNVIFTSSSRSAATLVDVLEQRIAKDLGVHVTVVVRTGKELASMTAGNPFVSRGVDPSKLHVALLAAAPEKKRLAALAPPEGEPEELSVAGKDIYLHCPNGYGRTKLSNAYIEKKLGVAATTRNWKTVTKLCELAQPG